MFSAARAHLPCAAERPVFVVRRAHVTPPCAPPRRTPTWSCSTRPSGQAETTQRALPALSPDDRVVSSCDHGLLWAPRGVEKLLAARPDVVVVGQRGYPDARRTRKATRTSTRTRPAASVGSREGAAGAPARKDLVLTGTFYSARRGLES